MMESHTALDLAAALDRFDGDHELFLTLAGMFVERAPQALTSIRTALAMQDLPLLAKEAHKLKGSALEFCAHPAAAAAAQLESSARQAAAQNMATLCERVLTETQRLTTELNGIMAKGFSS
jgi:HPt (histidine-containing phosphotransfer) domain-containing protein